MLTTKSQLDAQVIANPPIKQALLASQCPALFYRLPRPLPAVTRYLGDHLHLTPQLTFTLIFFFLFCLHLVAWGIKIPDQGLNPCPPQWKLTTRPPGQSLHWSLRH